MTKTDSATKNIRTMKNIGLRLGQAFDSAILSDVNNASP